MNSKSVGVGVVIGELRDFWLILRHGNWKTILYITNTRTQENTCCVTLCACVRWQVNTRGCQIHRPLFPLRNCVYNIFQYVTAKATAWKCKIFVTQSMEGVERYKQHYIDINFLNILKSRHLWCVISQPNKMARKM